MSDYQFDFTNYDREMHEAVKGHTEYHSETDPVDVYIGNGKTPPTVVIPVGLRSDPKTSIYCVDANAETKGLYHVVNSRNLIPNQNVNAGLKAKIAKPPNSNQWHLVEVDLTQTGGIHPMEVRTQQERQITPDRYQEIRLASNGTLIPDFIGGKIRVNGEWKPVPSGTGPDLTSHVPATANKERWVLVGVDPDTGVFDVVDGSDFDLGTANNPESDAPKTSAAGYFPFEVVKLTNGDTETQDTQMLPLSMIPAFTEAGGGAMTSFDIDADSGTAETVTDGQTINFVGGTGLSTVASAPDTITTSLDDTTVTPGSYTYASLTVDQQGRLTAASNGAAPGTMSSFDVNGDSGSAQTISNGNTLLVAGGTGIDTVASATDTLTINIDSTVATLTGAQVLTNKTLTAPTIGDFTNAAHNHQNAAGGGTLDAAAIASGTLDNARVNWAAPGTIGSGTPNTGSFTTLNTSGEVVFNEAGANVDFRVETDNDANAFIVDGGTDSVSIGAAAVATIKLGVTSTFADAAPSFNSGMQIDVTQTGASTTGLLAFRLIAKGNPGSTNTMSQLYAVSGLAIMNGAGTITTAYAGIGRVDNTSTGTITTAYGLALLAHTNSGGGTVGTAIGLDIGNQTVGSTANIAIRTGAGNVIINESGNTDSDVRMEGDTNANLFFLDASADTVNIGSTFRHTGSSLGFYNVSAVARPAAYTQTYSTTTRTINPASTAAFTGIASGVGGTPYAQLTSLNQLRTDHLALAQALNQVIDDLQANGLLQ